MPTQRPKIKHPPKQSSQRALQNALKRRARKQRFRLRIVKLITIATAIGTALFIFFGLGLLISPPDINVGGNKANPFIIRTPKIPPPPKDMIILLMGVDVNPEGKSEKDAFWGVRTDTIMLARIRSKEKEVSVVSIPRDSKVYLTQSGRIGKVNSAFSIGGAKQAVRVVERATGIPIDHYAVINLHGIVDAIDALGGVDLYIEKAMRYNDNSGNLHINFEPGQHHLDGQKAMEYLRFRHDELGDIGRIRRQQKMMSALTKRFNDPWIITKIPGLIDVALPHVKTDLSTEQLLQLGWFGRNINRSSVHVSTLPGYTSNEDISYWVIKRQQAKKLLTHTLLTPKASTEPNEKKSANKTAKPTKIGLLYPEHIEESVNRLALALEDKGFTVICQQPKENLATEILQHDTDLPQNAIHALKNVDSSLQQANHVIAPIGGTFEHLYCSPREDITLTLGNDLGL